MPTLNRLHTRIGGYLDTIGLQTSKNYLKQAEEIIYQKKGTIKTIHKLFTATIDPNNKKNSTPQAIKTLQDLAKKQKEKEGIIFKIFFSIFNSGSIFYTKKMQRYHDIESYVLPTEPDQSQKDTTVDRNDKWRREYEPSELSKKCTKKRLFYMSDKNPKEQEDKIKEAKTCWKTWIEQLRAQKDLFKSETKPETPKPEQIPFRRPKPEVLEETSLSKDLDGGSIYDPVFFEKPRKSTNELN